MPHAITDRYAVLGRPIGHSRSPWIHARFAALTQQRIRYDAIEVPTQGLAACLPALVEAGLRGCNVTVPCKSEACALADEASVDVALAQAGNTLCIVEGRIVAHNTDGIGLVRDLEQNARCALAGRRILLLGAGGAAAGVLGPLLRRRPAWVTVANRTISRAEELVHRHQALARECGVALHAAGLADVAEPVDVLCNASSSSLHGAPVPVDARVLHPATLAYDLMYGAAAQPFLAWARHHGAQACDGLGMLVEQAAESFWLWRGVRPPTGEVLAALRAMVEGAAP
ncbi:shikimate dehydrogenase [Candidatus Symbiobacter mobilis]|uniref:Shikimate dehydrogenase (NADP(+)) n=1 Tax=Candidatus Symbiobacter mobilis CR TaxID=946483 RepID=U5NBW0_9BURK|nr:shikimate dehydrogenase [Candidatus Symbiobacter mobilis]AGX87669.1 shikimate 5-dehydrogenase [Candidatus Symbiobacter mobilis CR]